MPDRDFPHPKAEESFESTYPKYEFSELVRLSLALADAWARWRGPPALRAGPQRKRSFYGMPPWGRAAGGPP